MELRGRTRFQAKVRVCSFVSTDLRAGNWSTLRRRTVGVGRDAVDVGAMCPPSRWRHICEFAQLQVLFSRRAEGQRSRTTTTPEAGHAAPPPRPLCPPYSRPLYQRV